MTSPTSGRARALVECGAIDGTCVFGAIRAY
jgi:hypothetical protein